METIGLKSEIYDLVKNTDDIKVLFAIKMILTKKKSYKNDFWDTLPNDVKNNIAEALKDVENGNIFEHEDVVQEMKAKYGISL